MSTKSYKMNKRLFIFLFVALIVFVLFQPIPSFAGSWTQNLDQSMYNGTTPIYETEEVDGEQSYVASLLGGLLVGLGDWLYLLLASCGISLDTLVYGRVGTGLDVSLYRFELTQNNPFGVVGSVVYVITKTLIIGFLACVFMGKLGIAAYRKGSAGAKVVIKDVLLSTLVAIAAIELMPYVLDVVLYLRDVILNILSNVAKPLLLSGLTGVTSTGSMQQVLRAAAVGESVEMFSGLTLDSEGNLMVAAIYLASAAVSAYLAAMYVGLAMEMMIRFFAFPFICLKYQFDKKIMSDWVWRMISCVCVPIIDAVLLLLPAFIGKICGSTIDGFGQLQVAIVQFLVCSMIIPARSIFASALGLQIPGLGAAGVGAMMAMGKLLGTMAKNLGGAIAKSNEASELKKGAKLEDALAKAEKEDMIEKSSQDAIAGGKGKGSLDSSVTQNDIGENALEGAGGKSEGDLANKDVLDNEIENQQEIKNNALEELQATGIEGKEAEKLTEAMGAKESIESEMSGIQNDMSQKVGAIDAKIADLEKINSDGSKNAQIRALNAEKNSIRAEGQQKLNEKQSKLDEANAVIKQSVGAHGVNSVQMAVAAQRRINNADSVIASTSQQRAGTAQQMLIDKNANLQALNAEKQNYQSLEGQYNRVVEQYGKSSQEAENLGTKMAASRASISSMQIKDANYTRQLCEQTMALSNRYKHNMMQQQGLQESIAKKEQILSNMSESNPMRAAIQKSVVGDREKLGKCVAENARCERALSELNPNRNMMSAESLTVRNGDLAVIQAKARMQRNELAREQAKYDKHSPEAMQLQERINSIDAQMDVNNVEIASNRALLSNMAGSSGGYGSGGGRGTGSGLGSLPSGGAMSFDQRQSLVYERYANVHNFMDRNINMHLSHERQAELMRQRASNLRREAVSDIAGGFVGGSLGAVTGMMLGPMGMAITTAAGIKMGETVGSVPTNLLNKVINSSQDKAYYTQGTIPQTGYDLMEQPVYTHEQKMQALQSVASEMQSAYLQNNVYKNFADDMGCMARLNKAKASGNMELARETVHSSLSTYARNCAKTKGYSYTDEELDSIIGGMTDKIMKVYAQM